MRFKTVESRRHAISRCYIDGKTVERAAFDAAIAGLELRWLDISTKRHIKFIAEAR